MGKLEISAQTSSAKDVVTFILELWSVLYLWTTPCHVAYIFKRWAGIQDCVISTSKESFKVS